MNASVYRSLSAFKPQKISDIARTSDREQFPMFWTPPAADALISHTTWQSSRPSRDRKWRNWQHRHARTHAQHNSRRLSSLARFHTAIARRRTYCLLPPDIRKSPHISWFIAEFSYLMYHSVMTVIRPCSRPWENARTQALNWNVSMEMVVLEWVLISKNTTEPNFIIFLKYFTACYVYLIIMRWNCVSVASIFCPIFYSKSTWI